MGGPLDDDQTSRPARQRRTRRQNSRRIRFPRAAHDMTAAPADRATGPKRGSPFYWVAFVLSGDWR